MIGQIKRIISFTTVLMALLAIVGVANPVIVAAQGTPAPAPAAPTASTPKQDVCKGLGLAGPDCNDPASSAVASKSVNDTIASAIAILSYIIGIIAVIMIMIGGLKYITSSGDSGNITSAKNTILYAVIGLVVALFAQLIVRFVINRI